jgi:exodeoxyribonuclease VII small subunit
MADTDLTYEQALALFDENLKKLEDGDLSLEAALDAVDNMQVYLRICQQRLDEAKKRIEVRPAADPAPGPEPASEPQPELDEPESLFR